MPNCRCKTCNQCVTARVISRNGTTPPPVSTGCHLYGDGLAGDFTADDTNNNWVDTPPMNNNFKFNNFLVPSGITLTVASGTKIRVFGDFINMGTIEVESPLPGERTEQPQTALDSANSQSIPTLGFGGVAHNEETLRNLLDPGILGGGNGDMEGSGEGGSGGGVLSIYVRGTLTLATGSAINAVGGPANTVSSDPVNGDLGNGGGGGGIIILVSKTAINGNGIVNVSGGDGSDAIAGTDFGRPGGGGGGGGLIHFLSINADMASLTVNTNVSGGAGGDGSTGDPVPQPPDGGGGGAMGGNGGNGGSGTDNSDGTDGADGKVIVTRVASPECLFV